MSPNKEKLILLCAGGTGGHIMPAQALALDLKSRGYMVEWVTDDRGLKFLGSFEGIPHHLVKSGTFGAGLGGKVKGVSGLAVGLVQAHALLTARKPSVVVGFGGYPSFPTLYAAQNRKIPTLLHEQNAIIGKANHMLAPHAERIASSVPTLQGIDRETETRTVYTGNPVRPEIASLFTRPYPSLDDDGELRILVMGGSLGAKVFSDILPHALSKLPKDQRARLNITQQCREEFLEEAIEVYERAGIKANLSPFISNVAEELEKAHLFIGRSGASTVAEITAAGRPAIFVPYPHHKDQQQKRNADVVADQGGAWVMTDSGFTVEAVQARIETILQNPSNLFKAAEKARECGRPDAARKLGNLVTEMFSDWNKKEMIVE